MKTTEKHIKDAIEHLEKASECMEAALDATPNRDVEDMHNLLMFTHVSKMRLPRIGLTMHSAMVMPNVIAYYLETSVLGKTYPE